MCYYRFRGSEIRMAKQVEVDQDVVELPQFDAVLPARLERENRMIGNK